MKFNRMGNAGIKVSSLCMGTMTFGAEADEAESSSIYAAGRDKGINFFDCANLYAGGNSEKILGKLIKGHREEVVISSKAYYPVDAYAGHNPVSWGRGLNRTHVRRAVDDSLRRLNTEYIDVYYMHHYDDDCTMEESLSIYNDLVREGKINYIGLSNMSAWQYMKAAGICRQYNYAPISAVQPMYNLLKRQCECEILPMALSEGIGVFSYSPLAGGVLTGKYLQGGKEAEQGRLNNMAMYKERYKDKKNADIAADFVTYAKTNNLNPISLAIAWAEAHPGITAPIIGGRSAEQIKPSLDAADIELSPDMHEDLNQMSYTPEPATDRSEEGS